MWQFIDNIIISSVVTAYWRKAIVMYASSLLEINTCILFVSKSKVYFIRKKRTYFHSITGCDFYWFKKLFFEKSSKFEIYKFILIFFLFWKDQNQHWILINCHLKTLYKMTFKHPAKRSGFLYLIFRYKK